MNKLTPEQIAKLPKWAVEYISNLEYQREEAINTLNQSLDGDTPTPFWVDYSPLTGERLGPVQKRRYIQAHEICVEWRGVWLRVSANDYGNRGPGIGLSWGAGPGHHGECALIPLSYQSCRIVAADDLK